MTKLRRFIFILLVVLTSAGCDQLSKLAAKTYLPVKPVLSYLGDTLRIQYAENSGAFLSIGASLPETMRILIFIGAVALFLLAVFCYLIFASKLDMLTVASLSLVLGGGIGNLIDRIAYGGHVIDFINLGIGGLRTGIFNIADVAIMLGIVLFVAGSFPGREKEQALKMEE